MLGWGARGCGVLRRGALEEGALACVGCSGVRRSGVCALRKLVQAQVSWGKCSGVGAPE